MSGAQLENNFKYVEELYDKYKHMDNFLTAVVPGDSFEMFVLKDFWEAISYAVKNYRSDKMRYRG